MLGKHDVHGTFYFSVGPDNMGRHLWRLLRPAFLWKMLRTNAAGLYGPEIVLMGTAWPGPRIGRGHADVIRAAAQAGHEVGFHAWDHHKAQAKLTKMSADAMRSELRAGMEELERIIGTLPAPAPRRAGGPMRSCWRSRRSSRSTTTATAGGVPLLSGGGEPPPRAVADSGDAADLR
ncbi:MAG: polysaccharide deacetylase family protein [Lentisphaeria bacterium]|nr:MAG: polysaccharide deacetylase family protein [Lentisphaeria bacterium]